MDTQQLLVYADTSVFGGVFDEEFATTSETFFKQVRQGKFLLVTSAVVQAEIETAPAEVQQLFKELLPQAHVASVDERVIRLQQGYLSAGIITEK